MPQVKTVLAKKGAFDPSTAKPFDPSSAKPISEQAQMVDGPTHAQSVGQILNAGPTRFAQGLNQIAGAGRSPEAGVMNLASGLAETVASPIGVAQYGLQHANEVPGFNKEIPRLGGSLGGALKIGGDAIGLLSELPVNIKRGLADLLGVKDGDVVSGINAYRQSVGLSPIVGVENQREMSDAVTTATDLAAQAAAVPAVKAAGRVAGGALGAVTPESLPLALETRSLKQRAPSDLKLETFDRPAKSKLQGNIQTNREGATKLLEDMRKTRSEADGIVNMSANSGTVINTTAIYDALDKYQRDTKGKYTLPEVRKAVALVKNRIAAQLGQVKNGQARGGDIPIDAAQKMKSSLWDAVAEQYGKDTQGTSAGPYEKRAIEIAGHATLDEMVKAEPRLKELGIKERNQIELYKTLAPRVMAAEKSNPINWQRGRELAYGAGAGYLTDNPLVGAGVAIGMESLTNPVVLHAIAQMIYNRQQKPISMSGLAGPTMALTASRADAERPQTGVAGRNNQDQVLALLQNMLRGGRLQNQ